MTDMRAWKIANIANDIEPLELNGDEKADTLVLGWGSTYGGITQAVNRLNEKGVKVASAHLTFINPFPDNLGEILSKFERIIIPELNTGQLIKLIRERFLIDAKGINKVAGEPFTAQELAEKIYVSETEIIRTLFLDGVIVNINQVLDIETAIKVGEKLDITIIASEEEIAAAEEQLPTTNSESENVVAEAEEAAANTVANILPIPTF